MHQKVTLLGRLGADMELRYTQAGSSIGKFSVATSERWRDKNTGEQKEHTEWHNCEMWGQIAETMAKYIHKGSLVYVEGRIRTDRFKDNNGVEKFYTKIRVDVIRNLTPKGDGPSQGQQPQQRQAPGQPPQRGAPAQQPQRPQGGFESTPDDIDADIPF